MRLKFGVLLLTTSALLVPSAARAQSGTTGAIAGIVRDATGAVLPAVTVEAASPALIEKVRVVTSDEQGNYRIVDLRPGTYSVTFTLPGFASFKRDGIELTTGFTATVNAELRVGAQEETVTVTGARAGATVLSKATAILSVLFMLGAMALSIMGRGGSGSVVSGTSAPAPIAVPKAPITVPAPTGTTAPQPPK